MSLHKKADFFWRKIKLGPWRTKIPWRLGTQREPHAKKMAYIIFLFSDDFGLRSPVKIENQFRRKVIPISWHGVKAENVLEL